MTIEAPSPLLWAAGLEMQASLLNNPGEILQWLLDPPEVEVKQTTTQSITTGSWQAASFNSVVKDNFADFEGGAAHWVVGSPTVITIQAPGWYEAELTTAWPASTATKRMIHALRINNSASADFRGRHDRKLHPTGTGTAKTVKSVYDIFLNPADTVNLMLWQDSGGSLSTAVGGPETRLALRWVSLSGI